MPSFNPLVFAGQDISTKKSQQLFLSQLSLLLDQLLTGEQPQTIANLLNGLGLLKIGALTPATKDFGTVTTNQSQACDGATSVSIRLAVSTAITVGLTLTHLSIGVPVQIVFVNLSAGSASLQLAATDPSGTAYTALTGVLSTGGTTNLTTSQTVGAGLAIWLGGNSIPPRSLLFGQL